MNGPTYTVSMMEKATGITLNIRQEWTGDVSDDPDDDWHNTVAFNWGENNYSCDCNRRLVFKRANGEETDVMLSECGNSAYHVNHITDDATGEIIYGGDE